jgi:peptide subunit release factor 1 (eRF1)
MNFQGSRRVAIWVDHREAIVITLRGDKVTDEEEFFSEAGPHTHGGGWAQHRIESHRHEMLKHYYEEVVQHLGSVDEILLLGPGQAKYELRQAIDHHKGLRGKVVAVRDASQLTEEQVMAEAEDFFALRGKEVPSST